MIVKCMTEGCENYGILVERNMTPDGQYVTGGQAICEICGKERVLDAKATYRNPSFAIDEIALGTKRLFDKPKL